MKYRLVVRILQACFHFPGPVTSDNSNNNSDSDDVKDNDSDKEYWKRVYGCALVNTALCLTAKYPSTQLHGLFLATSRGNTQTSSVNASLAEALACTQLAITLCPHPMVLARHAKLLERLGRFDEALSVLAEVRAMLLMQDDDNNHIYQLVGNHMEWNVFAQLHLLEDHSMQCLDIHNNSNGGGNGREEYLIHHLLSSSTAVVASSSSNKGAESGGDKEVLQQMKAYHTVLDQLVNNTECNSSNKAWLAHEPVSHTVWENYLISWEHSLIFKRQRFPSSHNILHSIRQK